MAEVRQKPWIMIAGAIAAAGGVFFGVLLAALGILLAFLNILSGQLEEAVEGVFWASAIAFILGGVGVVGFIGGLIYDFIIRRRSRGEGDEAGKPS